MGPILTFAVPSSSNLYRLRVGETLADFIGFDFTYFWEQCLELAHRSRSTGEYYWKQAVGLKEFIRGCHPYYQVLINADFDLLVLDCIIDFISHSENVGLEELWARYISTKDNFGKEVFARISAYKTGAAINQWANLLRMQEYAGRKAAFLFDGPQVNPEEYDARKQYFDLAFSVAAEQMGYTPDELPSIKCCSAASLPGATALFGNFSRELRASIQPAKARRSKSKKSARFPDQAAGLVSAALRSLPRPQPMEMQAAVGVFSETSGQVFLPSSLKAILDLEFDAMLENGLVLYRADGELPWQVVTVSNGEPETASFRSLAIEVPFVEPEPEPELEPVPAPQQADRPWPAPEGLPPADRPAAVLRLAQEPRRTPSGKREDQNINVRSQLMYSSLYSRVGKSMEEPEFQLWSRELMSIRRLIINKEKTVDDLEKYLDATAEIYHIREE